MDYYYYTYRNNSIHIVLVYGKFFGYFPLLFGICAIIRPKWIFISDVYLFIFFLFLLQSKMPVRQVKMRNNVPSRE